MSTTIDPYNVIPKYHQLALILKAQIVDGNWPPRSAIPAERQLETIYSISRTTIREAINLLIQQGYLYREHGRGTFVSPQKLQKKIMELTSFSEDMVKRGIRPGQIIRKVEIITPPTRIQRLLELPPNNTVIEIDRIRLGDGKPIGLQTSYIALQNPNTITKADLEELGSLYKILEQKFHIIPSEAEETLEVTLADLDEAKLLGILPGAPLLLSQRLLFDQNRKPVEFVRILYRGDKYQYYIRLVR
jgi:GntR family transcriptional regulator